MAYPVLNDLDSAVRAQAAVDFPPGHGGVADAVSIPAGGGFWHVIAALVWNFAARFIDPADPPPKTSQVPAAGRNATQALVDGANISWDLDLGAYATITIAGDRTMNNPGNTHPGQHMVLVIDQFGGGHHLAWGSNYLFPGGSDPVLSFSGPDVITFEMGAGGVAYCTSISIGLS